MAKDTVLNNWLTSAKLGNLNAFSTNVPLT